MFNSTYRWNYDAYALWYKDIITVALVNYLKFQILEELPYQTKSYLNNFEVKDIRIIKSVLLKGKKLFNNTNNTYYRLEDVEF